RPPPWFHRPGPHPNRLSSQEERAKRIVVKVSCIPRRQVSPPMGRAGKKKRRRQPQCGPKKKGGRIAPAAPFPDSRGRLVLGCVLERGAQDVAQRGARVRRPELFDGFLFVLH